jgi:hypothetical protein
MRTIMRVEKMVLEKLVATGLLKGLVGVACACVIDF